MNRGIYVGVDPGLVHTGVVVFQIDFANHALFVEHFIIEGDNHASQVHCMLEELGYSRPSLMVIEAYRERANAYATDNSMRKLLTDFRQEFHDALVLDNTGVKKVVRKPLLQVLGLHKFPTTHHQDLESAARILVYGMLKDTVLNTKLAGIVVDHSDGRPWPVQN